MKWIVFAYSLSKEQSSTRVSLWRRLQRLGAVAPAGNLYVLPAKDECIEAFQWLTKEIQEAGGQAIMFYCQQVAGMTEDALIRLFCEARAKDYALIWDELALIEGDLKAPSEDLTAVHGNLTKLRRQFVEFSRIDYFDCPETKDIQSRLAQIERQLAGDAGDFPAIATHDPADFVGKTWVTRPQPYVDRLASIWLINRFIDPDATFRFGHQPEPHEISFDMPDAQFRHVGNLCTFEVLMASFNLASGALTKLAQIIHEMDLYDGLYHHPEISGLEMVLKGWLGQGLSDQELQERGIMLFDGLLAAASF